MNTSDSAKEIKDFSIRSGADLVGIADIGPLKRGLAVIPEDLLEGYRCAVSVAVRLSDDVVNAIDGSPTPEYAEQCKDINKKLDSLTAGIVKWISERGFRAQAVPASMKVDDAGLCGSISHKAVARMAGIGWQGKSLLIVTPQFGPRVRLSTVLTDMPLQADVPLKNRCGKCTKCTEACPSGAIRNVSTDSNYTTREEAIDLEACHAKLNEFMKLPGVGYTFCGVCIRACPRGKKKPA